MALQALDAICLKCYSGMCHGWTSKLQKTLNRGFRIAITGYTYGAALLCCVFLCHWCHVKLIFLLNVSLVTMQAYPEAKLANVVTCWKWAFFKTSIIFFFVPLVFCTSIVFNFSWDLQLPEEKLKMMLMQNFRGTTKSSMIFLKKANYWWLHPNGRSLWSACYCTCVSASYMRLYVRHSCRPSIYFNSM